MKDGSTRFVLLAIAIVLLVGVSYFTLRVDVEKLRDLQPSGWSDPAYVGVLYSVMMIAFTACWYVVSLEKTLMKGVLYTIVPAWLACVVYFVKMGDVASEFGDAGGALVAPLVAAGIVATLTPLVARDLGRVVRAHVLPLVSFGFLLLLVVVVTIPTAVMHQLSGDNSNYVITPGGTVLVGAIAVWPLVSEALWTRLREEPPSIFRLAYAFFMSVLVLGGTALWFAPDVTGGWLRHSEIVSKDGFVNFVMAVGLMAYISAGTVCAYLVAYTRPGAARYTVVAFVLAGATVGSLISVSWSVYGDPWGELLAGWWVAVAHTVGAGWLGVMLAVAPRVVTSVVRWTGIDVAPERNGDARTPPGDARTPPGDARTPPGDARTPPVRYR